MIPNHYNQVGERVVVTSPRHPDYLCRGVVNRLMTTTEGALTHIVVRFDDESWALVHRFALTLERHWVHEENRK